MVRTDLESRMNTYVLNLDREHIGRIEKRFVDYVEKSVMIYVQKAHYANRLTGGKPLNPDMSDLMDLSYYVGVAVGSQIGRQGCDLDTLDPLKDMGNSYKREFQHFRNSGAYIFRYFDLDTRRDVFLDVKDHLDAMDTSFLPRISQRCAALYPKLTTFNRLADYSMIIKSLINPSEPELTIGEIDTLAGYLRRQAEIYGILYDALVLVSQRIIASENQVFPFRAEMASTRRR